MRVAYFPNQCAQNSKEPLEALLSSLRDAGHVLAENSMDADAVVVWSVLWHGRMSANQGVYLHYRSLGRPVIVIDVGSLYRGETWKIAVNHITAEGYYGHTEQLDWDRPKKLGISLAINLTRNPAILLAGQHPKSLQVSGIVSQEEWANQKFAELRQITDRPVFYRPHPRATIHYDRLQTDIVVIKPLAVPGTYDTHDMHFDYHAIVNHNSGPGIQAGISGTRPVVDTTSLAYPVSIKLHDIDKPYQVDRDKWLVEICHTEYTVIEIKQGQWLQRLHPSLAQ
jgi:hypothetical protein